MSEIVVFVYDFPHRKTQDFLFRLAMSSYRIAAVIAAPYRSLDLPPRSLRVAPVHVDLLHPRDIAQAIGVPYLVRTHDAPELPSEIREMGVGAGVIAGARILPGPLVEALPLGILNFHPALLPASRGLDSWLWDLVRGRPLGVSAHLIDARVDAGRLVMTEKVDVLDGDELSDVSMRLSETQNNLLIPALDLVWFSSGELPRLAELAPLQHRMDDGLVRLAAERLATRAPRGRGVCP